MRVGVATAAAVVESALGVRVDDLVPGMFGRVQVVCGDIDDALRVRAVMSIMTVI